LTSHAGDNSPEDVANATGCVSRTPAFLFKTSW
jgi:hypothetical protein